MVEAMARKWSGVVCGSVHAAQSWTEAPSGPPVTGVSEKGASVVQRGQVISRSSAKMFQRMYHRPLLAACFSSGSDQSICLRTAYVSGREKTAPAIMQEMMEVHEK